MKFSSFIHIITIIISCAFVAESNPIQSGTCRPYFASIKCNEANLHVGPGKEYKIIVKYVAKRLPVLIIAKYDHWRKIKDIDGTEGWMHKSLLSKDRYIIVKSPVIHLYSQPNSNSTHIAELRQHVIMKLLNVKPKWCYAKVEFKNTTYKGWIPQEAVFGTFINEQ